MATSDFAIRLDHVYKRFRRGDRHDSLRDLLPALVKRAVRRDRERALAAEEFWVLNDVTFEVKKGQTLGIIGHNGAGKSTMLKHLSGIMEPTRGRIEVNGRLSALIEVGAGFHPDLTGRENVFLNGIILGMSKAEIRSKFDEIVAFAGIEDFIDTPVKRYSSGMFARLGFSVAAHLEPDILVIDEVLSVGDTAFQRKGLEKMRAVARSGATAILVSHNLQAVADFCERAILLDHGRVAADGATDVVIRQYLDTARGAAERKGNGPVQIQRVTVTGADGRSGMFEAGKPVRVTVDLKATGAAEKMAVYIEIKNSDFYEVFSTASERLGQPSLSFVSGDTARCTFELDMHLGPGTYHLGASLYRYDIQKLYDYVFPALSFVVATDRDSRGPANLYPRVIEYQATPGREASLSPAPALGG
jgi:lipopolysaccharide transport system ATP-binding protein